MGYQAGTTSQSQYSVAIGDYAGNTSQGLYSVSIGRNAGLSNQGREGVAMGWNAGSVTQGTYSVAVGTGCGQNSQGYYAVAMGTNCGQNSQGNYSICLGYGTGSTSSGANSIYLNATNTGFSNTQTSSLFINPIRNATPSVGSTQILQYDPSTKEILYSTTHSDIGTTISSTNTTTTNMSIGSFISLLGYTGAVPNSISITSGVWIITTSYNPYVSTSTVNTGLIEMSVSDNSTLREMTSYPASKVINVYDKSLATGVIVRMTDTFVITTTATTNLYAWGYVSYLGGQWTFDNADLRATRIA